MQRVMAFVACLSAACSAVPSSVPATLPATFDPFAEVIEVPAELCAPLQGWYAMSERAVKEMLAADIERDRQCKASVARAQTAERVAQEQRAAAMEALDHAQWWSKWGPIVVLGVGLVSSTVGAIGGAAIQARK